MKVVSTEALTKLIQLVKSAFVKVEDVVETSEVTLADVAISGDYDDLINKPTIPTATSDLTNDSGYITTSALTPYVLSADLASVATSGSYNDLSDKPTIPSAVTEATVSGWGFTKNIGTVTSVNNVSPVNGNVTLSIPTVNNPTITFTQGGTTKGTITLNQSTNQTIAFDAGGGGSSYTAGTGIDITNDVISVTSPTLVNRSLQGLAIGGSSSVGNSTDIAICGSTSAKASGYNIAIGYGSFAGGSEIAYALALGPSAYAGNDYSIQLGKGTNSEANSFYVGTSASNNWKMLGSDGKIPSGRLPIATSVSSSSTNNETVGAKLFYDTCGDIETLINAL